MRGEFVLSSESVTAGHPDKLCDQISDAIVGRFLRREPRARVIAECAVSTGIVFLSVKHDTRSSVDIVETAREVIRDVGYESGPFAAGRCAVMASIDALPGRNHVSDDVGVVAQDQTTVFGFACTHNPARLPYSLWLAHQLARALAAARTTPGLEYLGPDGKVQVGIVFRDYEPVRVHSLTIVASHVPEHAPRLAKLRDDVVAHVIEPSFVGQAVVPDERTRIAVNPEGLYEGGPSAHAGLTGRKTAVDTYGEYARHGAAALSGKDPSRIDRSAAYAARHAAKNVVAAALARACEVQLSYAIGLAEPVSFRLATFGTAKIGDEEIERRVLAACDFRVGAIERRLGLRTLPSRHADGFYRRLAAYGHVGRMDLELPWEAEDLVDALR